MGTLSCHKLRCFRMWRISMCSSMKLMIFISLPHLGPSRGSTSQAFLIHSRQVLDGIFFCFGSDIFRTSIAPVPPPGGMKESGMGREKGRYGVESYLEYKTMYLSYEVPE